MASSSSRMIMALEKRYRHQDKFDEYFYDEADRNLKLDFFNKYKGDQEITGLLVRQASIIFAAMTGLSFTQYMLNILGKDNKERFEKIEEIAMMGLFVAQRKFSEITKLLNNGKGLQNRWKGSNSLLCQQVFRFVLVEAKKPRALGTLTILRHYTDAEEVYHSILRRLS